MNAPCICHSRRRTIAAETALVLAVSSFQQAIDRDPDYARAYVGIADVFNMLTEFCFIHPEVGYLKSRDLLKKAGEVDYQMSELFVSLAQITYCYEWDLPTAERYARRSIELNPSNMFAHAIYGEILGTSGRMEEAQIGYLRLDEEDWTTLNLNGIGPAFTPRGYLVFLRAQNLMAVGFDTASGTARGEPVSIPLTVFHNLLGLGYMSVSENGLLAYLNSETAS